MNLRTCWSSSLVMTNSSNSCHTEVSSNWSAFTTPLMGRKMSRSKRFLMSMGASLGDQLERSVVVFRLLGLALSLEGRREGQLSEQSEGQLVVLAWVEHHQRRAARDSLKVTEK